MLITCQIPVTEIEDAKFEALFNYSREYASNGYPGMDEPLKETADRLLEHEDLVLVASSAGRPQYRGAYAYLQFAAKPTGVNTIHRLYQQLLADMMCLRDEALNAIASRSTPPPGMEHAILRAAPEYYKQISSVSLCHSFKAYPSRLKIPGQYQAYTLRAPVETPTQQDLFCRHLSIAALRA